MKLILTTLLCLSALSISAQTVRPSVSVVGEASMKIAPDQVVFTLVVITKNKDLFAAKTENDARTAATITAVKEFQVKPADIQTDTLTVNPEFIAEKDEKGLRIFSGYVVTKKMFVTVRSLDRLEAFLGKVLDGGVNRVDSISIENGQYQKFQEQVRAMAVKNARTKARSYAAQLDQQIGKAYVIREEMADYPPGAVATGYGSGNGSGDGDGFPAPRDSSQDQPVAIDRQITFALGMITIEEKIYVTFELI